MIAGLPEGIGGNATIALRPDGHMASPAEQADLATAIAASLVMSSPNQSNGGAWVPESESEYKTYERQMTAMKHSAETKEGHDSRIAIQNSLETLNEPIEAPDNTEEVQFSDSGISSPGASKPRRDSNLADIIEDMAFRLATEMHMLNDPQGDTYVFIDPPAQQPEQDNYNYQRYRERYKIPLRMQMEKFTILNSAYFNKAFGPTAQYRVVHRRGLVGRLPDSIKYVLDLTPPTEGDYAAYLTAELCCPEGVRKWYQAGQRWNISSKLIGGQEEYAAPFRMRQESAQKVGDDSASSGTAVMGVERAVPPAVSVDLKMSQVTGEHQVDDSHHPTIELKNDRKDKHIPLEYSPVRHRSAIERVLHAAVEGLDPQIDSAPKLWTTFAVAKHYSIKHSLLDDYIVRWLRANPNSYFLEVLPEIALRISDGLECSELCRDTFAILVGEEALANVYRCRGPGALRAGRSVHGRKREDLPESYQTRVEYASKAFMERITVDFTTLADERMTWLNDLAEFRKLFVPELNHTLDRPDFSQLIISLKAYLRGCIYWTLCDDSFFLPGPLAEAKLDGEIEGKDLFPTTRFSTTWSQLLPRERIFTRSFWKLLSQTHYGRQTSNFCEAGRYSVLEKDWPDMAKQYEDQGLLKEIKKEHLDTLVRECNRTYREHPQVIAAQDVQAASPPSSSNSTIRPLLDRLGDASLEQAQVSLPTRTQQPKAHSKLRNILPKRSSKGGGTLGISTGVQGNVSVISLESIRDSDSSLLTYPVAAPLASDQNATASSLATQWPSKTSPFYGWTSTSYDPDLDEDSSQAQGADGLDSTSGDDLFSLKKFFDQVDEYLGQFCRRELASPDASMRADTLELMLTDTLVCLEDPEWKYLPLWAGGNDDESGGVFDDQIPLAHAGFSTAGPRVHTGVGSSAASSEFEVISNQTDGSTHHTSTVVNDGFTDTMDRRRVYDADTILSDVMANRDHDIESVRSKGADTPTIHGSEAGWDDFTVDVDGEGNGKMRTEDKGKGKMVDDEDMFDDVFTQEEEEDEDEDDDIDEDEDDNDNHVLHSLHGNKDDDDDDDDMVLV